MILERLLNIKYLAIFNVFDIPNQLQHWNPSSVFVTILSASLKDFPYFSLFIKPNSNVLTSIINFYVEEIHYCMLPITSDSHLFVARVFQEV